MNWHLTNIVSTYNVEIMKFLSRKKFKPTNKKAQAFDVVEMKEYFH